jgi:hypothetical protein
VQPLWFSVARSRITGEFSEPPVVLKIDDSIVGTHGNFRAWSSKGKSKKTFNICVVVAATD